MTVLVGLAAGLSGLLVGYLAGSYRWRNRHHLRSTRFNLRIR